MKFYNILKKKRGFWTENECNIHQVSAGRNFFFVVDSYNKFVLEGYGFYNENAEPNLTAASCESWI